MRANCAASWVATQKRERIWRRAFRSREKSMTRRGSPRLFSRLVWHALGVGDAVAARHYLEEAVTLARQLGNKRS